MWGRAALDILGVFVDPSRTEWGGRIYHFPVVIRGTMQLFFERFDVRIEYVPVESFR